MTRAILTCVLVLAWTNVAGAGEVSGVIDLPVRAQASVGVDLYAKYDSPTTTRRDDESRLEGVVFLKSSREQAVNASMPIPVMDQKNARFVPRIVPVPAGGSVRFLNSDPMFHNVFSLSPIKKFDLGRYPRGDSRMVTFQHPGVVRVFCDIHAEMIAYVVVLESRHFAVLDANGHYRITDVPPGTYEVGVWAEDMSQFEMVGSVTVPSSGAAEFTASLLDRR